MAVTKKEYILFTFVSSCISVGFLIGAFGTQHWIEGEGITGETNNDLINYGLFQGTFTSKIFATPTINSVYVACLLSHNICALSCKTTSDARKEELTVIYEGDSVVKNCDSKVEMDVNKVEGELIWMNGGVYVSTLLFLSLALLMSSMAALFGLYNTTRSPVEPLMGVYGLYVWNCCSALSGLLVLIIWGVHYETNITKNLSFTHIIMADEDYTGVISKIGFSYWFVLVSVCCPIFNVIMLGVRFYRISKEPPPPVINIEKNTDDTIFLY